MKVILKVTVELAEGHEVNRQSVAKYVRTAINNYCVDPEDPLFDGIARVDTEILEVIKP